MVLPVGLFCLVYLGAVIVPPGVEQIYVGPNQITLERPYLVRSIAGTRQAYGLDGPSVDERQFTVSAEPLTSGDLDRNGATLQDARIWDWRALEPQLQQIQGLRPYYRFAGVDIDRYRIDGVERQVMITARELDLEKLPAEAQVWVNLALKYTHGYGVVAAPVNEIDSRGNPVLWAHDIPIKAKGELAVTDGAIYYGSLTEDRVYVRTSEKEFDFPQGQESAETVYHGKGGISLSSFWRKLVVAHECDGLRLFISRYFQPDSRVLLHRNIVERVERLAPFITFDRDPYIVADGKHYASFEIRVGWGRVRVSREAQSRAGEARRSEPLTAPAGPDNRARLNAGMVRHSALAANGSRICRTNFSKRRSASANRGTSEASILMRRERC